jgi:single-stranded-DNA-specific exonuclease
VDRLPADLHPVLRRVYAARGVGSADALGRGLGDLAPLSAMSGLDEAAELLGRTIEGGGRILVVGDFDADGATSCAVAVRALNAMGAAAVHFLVPDRFTCGYGLSPAIVRQALRLAPDLIVTVDNGISSLDGVQAARAAGVPVLITDHHLPGDRLPDAAAIVDPCLPGNPFPSKHLAGVGVIFYVMAALRSRLRAEGWFERRGGAEPNLAELLDLVALGTVADVVSLDANNRILVGEGLRRIRAGRLSVGMRALLDVAGREASRAVAADLGFAVAPRLNAAGRLDDMSLGIACLLANDMERARSLAERLDGLNRERRAIEREMTAQADRMLSRLALEQEAGLPRGIALYDEQWHQGVIGILAGRLRDRWHRPVVAFAPADAGGMLRGSARSVPGVHVRDALEAVAAAHPGLLERFGGHARAAGLSLRAPDLERFREAFDGVVGERLALEDLQGVLYSDGPLSPGDFGLDLARRLREGGPWGQDFPEPLFDNELIVHGHRIVGEDHLRLRLGVPGTDGEIDAIAFRQAGHAATLAEGLGRVHAAFRLDINTYGGTERPQLVVEHLANPPG